MSSSAAEALYATNRTDATDAMSVDGLHAFVEGLPKVMADPSDLAAREVTQRGAWACGTFLGQVGMSLHHKLCHTLGRSFDLPHAETHAIVLPHAIAYNARSAATELKPVCSPPGRDQKALPRHDHPFFDRRQVRGRQGTQRWLTVSSRSARGTTARLPPRHRRGNYLASHKRKPSGKGLTFRTGPLSFLSDQTLTQPSGGSLPG